MHIFRHARSVPAAFRGSVLAIGDFDGVHLGHQALLAQARREAQMQGRPLTVLCFEPRKGEPRLTPLRTKARLLAGQGVEALFLLRDGPARIAENRFVENVLLKELDVCALLAGGGFSSGGVFWGLGLGRRVGVAVARGENPWGAREK